MKFATVAASPVFGGTLATVDDSKALAVKGVRQVVQLDDAVAVIADHMGPPRRASRRSRSVGRGRQREPQTADLVAQLEQGAQRPGEVAKQQGDVAASLQAAAKTIEADYQVPFLAHATMEPMNCTVHVRADGCDVWVGTQVLARAQATAAKVTGLPLDKVVVHNHLLGGGFGRRLEVDYVTQAVRIAKQVDGPVKVIWTREEDIQHDIYRPYYSTGSPPGSTPRQAGGLQHRIVGSSIIARWLPACFKNDLDLDAVDGAVELPYDFPNMLVEYVRVEPPPAFPPAGGAASASRTTSSSSRASSTSSRRGRQGSGRVSPRAAGQGTARRGGARSRRGEGRLGTADAGGEGPRRLGASRLRQLRRAGGRGGGRRRMATCG